MPNPRDLNDLIATIRRVKPAFFNGVPTLYIALLNHPDVQRGEGRFQVDQDLLFWRGRAAGRDQAPLRSADRRPHRRRVLADRSDDGALREPGEGPEQDRVGWHAAAGRAGPNLRRRRGHANAAAEGSRRDLPGRASDDDRRTGISRTRRPWCCATTLRSDDGGPRRWLHTGDLGYLDEDGYLFIVDRKKDMIKTSGFQVWPREIEEALAAHPAVAEVGVAGTSDAVKGEVVHAWVVLRAGQAATEQELRVLPGAARAYKVPVRVEFRDSSCRRRWWGKCCGGRSKKSMRR